MNMQITPAQMTQQAKAELGAISWQLEAFEKGIALMQEAQAIIRREEIQSAIETALDLFIGAQLTHALLNVEMMRGKKAQLEEFIKQAESPIQRASAIVPR